MRRTTTVLVAVAVLALPVLTAMMVVWHELGHTAAALLLGDPTAHFSLYLHTARSTCAGCNLYDSAGFGPLANAVVNAAGVVATGVLSWAAVLLLPRTRHRLLRWLLAELLALTVLGDLLFQTAQGLAGPVPDREPVGSAASYVDARAVVSFAAQATGASHAAVATVCLLVVAADLTALAVLLRRARRSGRYGPSRQERPASRQPAGGAPP